MHEKTISLLGIGIDTTIFIIFNCVQGGGIPKCLHSFEGGLAECLRLSTRGEGGVKKGPKSVYVVYGRPLRYIICNY